MRPHTRRLCQADKDLGGEGWEWVDITPDEKTFREKGTPLQPKPVVGDHEGADIRTIGLISDMEMTAEDMGRCKPSNDRDDGSVFG